jgi:hypothetical protein
MSAENITADQAVKLMAAIQKAEVVATHLSEERLLAASPIFTPVHNQFPAGQKTKILLADDFHINARNFGPLFEKLKQVSVTTTVAVDRSHDLYPMMNALGDYYDHQDALGRHILSVASLSFEQLFAFKYRNVPVLKTAKDEALAFVIVKDNWQENPVEKDDYTIALKLWNENKQELVLNCAACMVWADFWADFPALNTYDAAIVFSGSTIYSRTLLHLVHYTKAKAFVLESFMTGGDFFFEERHAPIANNTRMRGQNYRARYAHMMADNDAWERNKIISSNKLRAMQNKNVKQPISSPLPRSISSSKTMLVLGQVVNDFSLISGCGTVLNSIPAYKALISKLLSDPVAVVMFKSHPWENNKKHVGYAYTETKIREWAETLPDDEKNRLVIFSDWNLRQLLKISDFVFTLCSQSALEAAQEGLKPIVIGGSFFDGDGFTSNFSSPTEAAEAALASSVSGKLKLSEYRAFEDFLTTLVQCHLIESSAEGLRKITGLLRRYRPQAHVKTHLAELATSPTWQPLGVE